MSLKRIMIFLWVLVFAALLFFLVYKPFDRSVAPPEIHGLLLPETRGIAPFALKQAPNGQAFTERNFTGKWSFLFFGYTHCPDICPTTLAIMNQAWQLLDKQNATQDLQVIFVSVDPERDNLEKLGQYVQYFNPHFSGITGNETQLNQLAGQLGIVYEKDPLTRQDLENYLVNHGASIILINPKGEYQAFFSAPHDPHHIAQEFILLKDYLQ